MAQTQVLELPNRNDKVVDFRWEPRGSRFAVLHGEGPKPDLSVYAMQDMRTSTKGVQHIGSQPGKQANCIHWSPQVGGARRQPLPSLIGEILKLKGCSMGQPQAGAVPVCHIEMCTSIKAYSTLAPRLASRPIASTGSPRNCWSLSCAVIAAASLHVFPCDDFFAIWYLPFENNGRY